MQTLQRERERERRFHDKNNVTTQKHEQGLTSSASPSRLPKHKEPRKRFKERDGNVPYKDEVKKARCHERRGLEEKNNVNLKTTEKNKTRRGGHVKQEWRAKRMAFLGFRVLLFLGSFFAMSFWFSPKRVSSACPAHAPATGKTREMPLRARPPQPPSHLLEAIGFL